MKNKKIAILILGLFCIPMENWAQTEPEDIAVVSDEMQEAFYESLLQKGIENYDKAIFALEKCLAIQPQNATLHFEMGKNYLALKQYENAFTSFEKATQINPNNRWFWVGMYDVDFKTKNYTRAIGTVQKLIPFDEMYKDDLVPLLIKTGQSDKALEIIAEMNAKYGKSQERTQFKNQILLASKNESTEWKELSLFKNYLDAKEADKALTSMNTILNHKTLDSKLKQRVLNEFMLYLLKNPTFEAPLQKAIHTFENEEKAITAFEIGKWYHQKKQSDKAILFYEMALSTNKTVEIQLLLMQAYTETKQFQLLAQKATELTELFPAQSHFYYYTGLAYNQLQEFKKAKEFLEIGIDYVVDDLELEINFNLQLAEAFNGLKDFKKKELFFAKANELVKQKNSKK